MSSVILFEDKKDCCGCGACMNICPKNAISMMEDEKGFLYPKINTQFCVECGLCKTVCGYQNIPERNKSINVYAAASKDKKILKNSASGGAFAVLANAILNEKGVVYGAALVYENHKLVPKHIRIKSIQELIKLQGSKYVQSDIGWIYKEVDQDLKVGQKVLFSGTPCQVAGLKKYLKEDYENLLTVEIICHGVPSAKFFQDYINFEESKIGNKKIVGFLFRDKSRGQAITSRFIYDDDSSKVLKGDLTSYSMLFTKGFIYRKNCYSCPFAKAERAGDFTLGDFWGFHEEYLKLDKDILLDNQKGVSCVLVNTVKAQNIFEKCKIDFEKMESEFEKVARHNEQLYRPSQYNLIREVIMDLYQKKGYVAVDSYYKNHFYKERVFGIISWIIPKRIKRSIKKIIRKIKG